MQQKIDDGEIKTADELQTWIWRRGWRLRLTERVSKNGRYILIVSPGVWRGFQIEASFDFGSFKFQQPGIWIYALLARSAERKACYVGQSKAVMRRMAEHAKRTRDERASGAFFHWSETHGAKVNVALLELCRQAATKGETARYATMLEGAWLKAAIDAGYQAPDVQNWGRLPSSSARVRSFCEARIWGAAKPFDDVVQQSPPLKRFWLGPVEE